MEVSRLGAAEEAALEELLDQEPVVNLFLRGFLSVQPMDLGYWYGAVHGSRMVGALLLLPGRLMVPWSPDLRVAQALGAWLARRHPPTMCVGPRDQVDAIWSAWAGDRPPLRHYNQGLYVVRRPPEGSPHPGLRRARSSEWPLLAERAARMEYEDLGRDPSLDDAAAHARTVQDRIAAGKTLVLEHEGHVVFQVNLGTSVPDGVQVGGTYVPPRFRGRRWCVLGMHATVHHLLRRRPLVTLHVNEANPAAVRCYRSVGFEPYADYRLLTV